MNKMYPDWQIGKASINCNYDSFSRFPVEMIYQQLQGKASIRPMWVSDATKKGKTWGCKEESREEVKEWGVQQ